MSHCTEDGLAIVRLPRPPEAALTRRGFERYIAHAPLTYAALRWTRPDVAQAMYATDAIAAARYARASGRPAIYSYMGIPDDWWVRQRRLRLRMTGRAVARCDAVVALSRAAAAAFGSTFGVEARVIAPGVDLAAFTPGGERAPEPTIFCPAAIAEPAKRVPELLRAFARVRRIRPDARLVLSRPADPALGASVVADAPGVTLADVDHRADLRDAYRRAWMTVLPSVGEAFGLVLVESLACGTPVLGRARGGIPDIVDRDTVGALFEGDEEALARALLSTLDLHAVAGTAPACRERAADFSTASCVRAYESLYRELLADR